MSEELSKTERRRLAKQAKKVKMAAEKEANMTDRQKLRLSTKEKKVLPKLSRDDRNKKYQEELVEKPREQAAAKNLQCLHCKRKGHLFKDCPMAAQAPVQDEVKESVNTLVAPMNKQICYNCGSNGHALRTCKAPRHPDGKLPFASCFICKGTGHISKDCKENPNGLYPKGGGCLICESKYHFAKDCPEKKAQTAAAAEEDDEAVAVIGDHEDSATGKEKHSSKGSKRKQSMNDDYAAADLGGDDNDFDFDVDIPVEKGVKPEEEAEEEDEDGGEGNNSNKKKHKQTNGVSMRAHKKKKY